MRAAPVKHMAKRMVKHSAMGCRSLRGGGAAAQPARAEDGDPAGPTRAARLGQGGAPDPVGHEVDHQLHRKAAEEEEVEGVEHVAHPCRGTVLVQQLSIELRLSDGKDEILLEGERK